MDHEWKLSLFAGQSIPDAISLNLSARLESGELPGGEQLPNETTLAKRYGVSRNSVRTALQSLQNQGLVEVARGVGWRATSTPRRVGPSAPAATSGSERPLPDDKAQIEQLAGHVEVRRAIEAALAGLAASRATRGHLLVLQAAHEAHQQCDSKDVDGLLRTDEEFHRAIAEAAGDEVLTDSLAPILLAVRAFRRACFAEEGAGSTLSGQGHAMILDALVNRNSMDARNAMSAHLMMFASRMGSLTGATNSS